MQAIAGFVIDVLILVALVFTMRQAWVLRREFAQMQADRKAFESLIAALNIAASRAESAIKTLRETAVESGDTLQEKINAGRTLADELDIMIQAGDSLATRLTAAAEGKRTSSAQTQAAPLSAAMTSPPERAGAAPLSRAERELLEALQARQERH